MLKFPAIGPDRIPFISAAAHDLHAFLHGPGQDLPRIIESGLPETEGMHSAHRGGLVEEMTEPAASVDEATTTVARNGGHIAAKSTQCFAARPRMPMGTFRFSEPVIGQLCEPAMKRSAGIFSRTAVQLEASVEPVIH